MRRAKVLATCTLLAVLVLGAASCRLIVHAKRVLIIGDSLTVGATAAGLGDLSSATWTVDALTNRGTNAGVVAAQSHNLTQYDLVIVALGTNDYLDSQATYGTRIDAMMRVLGASRTVIWVNVDAHAPKLGAAADGVNPAIAAAPARHANLYVGDWDRYLATRSGLSGVRASDGVHYTTTGYALRARWLESFVA